MLDRLIARIGAAGVVTGEDFTFGKGRGGNVVGAARDRRARMASRSTRSRRSRPTASRSRRAGSANRSKPATATTAARLLTRPFAIEGVVEHGDKRGRTIGYPTANIGLGHYLRPRFGIYAVRGRLPDGRILDGVANLGIRPTFEPARELLEPYFFDFSGDLYGQMIEVELISYIRPEARFDGLDALVAQMDLRQRRGPEAAGMTARREIGCSQSRPSC